MHDDPFDLARPLDLDGERQYLNRRQHEKLVRPEERRDARVERCLSARGALEVGGRLLQPLLDVPNDRVLELRASSLEIAAC